MPFSTIFFDLDDTLYPASTGLWDAIRERMNRYMHERLNISWEDIPSLRELYFATYGTTLRGLEANYGVHDDDYLTYVHDLPLADYLRPDAELRAVLEGLSARKFVFTNADSAHARRVMAALGVADRFDGIVDVHALAPYCKPQVEAFERALEIAGERDPHRCALIDDLPRTTRAARDLGFFSILFGSEDLHHDASATLHRWRDLPSVLDSRGV